MATENYDAIFEYPVKEFKKLLANGHNDKIIFSGKFGTGKTMFLDFFFSDNTQIREYGNMNYDVYWISPVHYSISSNDDVFKYIKYDLIIQLLEKNKQVRQVDLRLIDNLPYFISENLKQVFSTLLYMIPKVGKEVSDYYDKILKLYESLQGQTKKSNANNGDKLIDYINDLEKKEGSIYEDNVITNIIRCLIKTNIEPPPALPEIEAMTSASDAPEETEVCQIPILIIDDLDRLDPEHIFRILNVFAAHFKDESKTGIKNKFGFEKILIVCDIKNIRQIYHHKYGKEVDFTGYINKFYNSTIYHFDNKKAIVSVLDKVIDSLKWVVMEAHAKESSPLHSSTLYHIRNNSFALKILTLLVKSGLLSLRSIVNVFQEEILFEAVSIGSETRFPAISPVRIPFLIQLKIISYFLVDKYNMEYTFKACNESQIYFDEFEKYLKQIIFLKSRENASLEQSPIRFIHRGVQIEVNHSFDGNRQIQDVFFSIVVETGKEKDLATQPIEVSLFEFWKTLTEFTSQLYSIGFLQDR